MLLAQTIHSQRLFPSTSKFCTILRFICLESILPSVFRDYLTPLNIAHASYGLSVNFHWHVIRPQTHQASHRHCHWVGWCRLQPSSPEYWALTRSHRIQHHWAQTASTAAKYLWMGTYLPSTSRRRWSSEGQPMGLRWAWTTGRRDVALNTSIVLTKKNF